jgi:plasmid replication initiation protein
MSIKFRSYREFRDKIEKDPSYQKMVLIWKDVICYLQRRYNDKSKVTFE